MSKFKRAMPGFDQLPENVIAEIKAGRVTYRGFDFDDSDACRLRVKGTEYYVTNDQKQDLEIQAGSKMGFWAPARTDNGTFVWHESRRAWLRGEKVDWTTEHRDKDGVPELV